MINDGGKMREHSFPALYCVNNYLVMHQGIDEGGLYSFANNFKVFCPKNPYFLIWQAIPSRCVKHAAQKAC